MCQKLPASHLTLRTQRGSRPAWIAKFPTKSNDMLARLDYKAPFVGGTTTVFSLVDWPVNDIRELVVYTFAARIFRSRVAAAPRLRRG